MNTDDFDIDLALEELQIHVSEPHISDEDRREWEIFDTANIYARIDEYGVEPVIRLFEHYMYLSCHGDDLERALWMVEEEFFRYNWLPIDTDASYAKKELDYTDERDLRILQKRICASDFMMVCFSEKYLFSENPARDIEYRIAAENGIPVLAVPLPILDETEIIGYEDEKAFYEVMNRICPGHIGSERMVKDLYAAPFFEPFEMISDAPVVTCYKSLMQSRRRIYLSCHPEDAASHWVPGQVYLWFPPDSACYYAKAEADYTDAMQRKEIEKQILRADIVVFYVSEKFLNERNRARDFEFAFAMQNHKSMLPVLLKDVTAAEFEEKMNAVGRGYGGLQCLVSDANDEFDMQLDFWNNSAFEIGLESDRIWKAFDIRIFISYRKKNQIECAELMRRIHSIPGLEGAGLWTDSMLLLGDAWDDDISKALSDSDLVILSVTPDVLEEDNYIIQYEYPQAVSENKRVIPVEMRKTRREELKAVFQDLPPVVVGDDIEGIAEAIRGAMNGASSACTRSPENEYLIGRAYVRGCFAENDADRAKRLITSAADRGCREARHFLYDAREICRNYNNRYDMRKIEENYTRIEIETMKAFFEND